MDANKLAGLLHNAGLSSRLVPQSHSGNEWNDFRLKLAANLLSHLDNPIGKGSCLPWEEWASKNLRPDLWGEKE